MGKVMQSILHCFEVKRALIYYYRMVIRHVIKVAMSIKVAGVKL